MKERELLAIRVPGATEIRDAFRATETRRNAGKRFLRGMAQSGSPEVALIKEGQRLFLFNALGEEDGSYQPKRAFRRATSVSRLEPRGFAFEEIDMKEPWNEETDRAVVYGKIKSKRALQARRG
jgi:hypothetical protein